jgi:hypothetical protein
MSARALARGFFSLIEEQKPDANASRLIRRKPEVVFIDSRNFKRHSGRAAGAGFRSDIG